MTITEIHSQFRGWSSGHIIRSNNGRSIPYSFAFGVLNLYIDGTVSQSDILASDFSVFESPKQSIEEMRLEGDRNR